MADTDLDQPQVDQQAQAQQNPIFSAKATPTHLIPLENVKRLGEYRPEERPTLRAIFEKLTSFIGADYRLLQRQEITIRLKRTGDTKLTTENNPLYGELTPDQQKTTLSFLDLIQITSDIARWLRRNEQSEELIEFDSIDDEYWLKEIADEETPNFISNIIPKDKVAKLQRELFADIWDAFKVGETEEGEVVKPAAGQVSGSNMPGEEELAAAVTAYRAGASDQSEAGDGDQGETTAISEETQQEELGLRERQTEQAYLLATLQQELFVDIVGDLTTTEIDQMWSDFQPGLIAEITEFFATHPELRAKLAAAAADDSLVRDEIYREFLNVFRANPNLTNRLVQIYEAVGDRAALVDSASAIEIQQKVAQVGDVIGQAAVSQVTSHIQQVAAIAQIPDAQPTPSVPQTPSTTQQTPTASESELQKNATEYLVEHAEYEIFRKTRIFLHQLSPELDLSAQNVRLLLREFARREALGLTATQLRLAQSDPTFLLARYQRFALDLQAQHPEITSFLIDYGRFIQQTDATEAAQFETVFRNGVLGKSVAAKDALATDLKSSLGGAATPIVVANTAATIDAMILEFGDKAPEFVEKISTDRLELAFGLAAGTLTANTAPIFVATLQSQLGLRLSELNLTVGGGFLQSGGLQGGTASSDPESIQQALSAIPQSRQMLTSHGAETTIAALGTPAAPIEKNHESWWSSLPKEVQLQLYDQVEGAGSSSQFAGFSSLPIPPKLGTYSNPEIRKLLVGIWTVSPQLTQQQTEDLKQVNLLLDAQDRLAIQQVKVAKLREEVLAAVIQDIKDEQAAIIAAQMGLAVAEGESNQVAIQNAMLSGAAPLAVAQLSGMNAAVSENPNALVGTDPYSHDYGQSLAGGNAQSAGMIRRALGAKIKQQLQNKLLKGLATKAGLATTGVGAPVAAGLMLLQNKTVRDSLAAGTAYLVGKTLYALTTTGGLAGAALGGLAGTFLIPVLGPGAPLYLGALGANIGAGVGGQWTSALGWTPHAPVSPFAASNSLSSGTGASTQSMSAMRAGGQGSASSGATASTSATQPLSYSQQSALTGAPTSSSVGISQTSPATAAASSSSLTGFLGATAAAVTATASPLIGIGIGIFLSLQVLFIIYGAFLIKVPSEGVIGKTEELSKYATLEKTATPNAIEDSDQPTPTDVKYSITLAPKLDYQLQVTEVTDTFSYQGCNKDQPRSCNLALKSSLSLDSFSTEPITTKQETSYNVEVSATDVMIINTLTITFDVFDSAGNKLSTNETITTLAAVVVGNPSVGCFLFDSTERPFKTSDGTLYSIGWTELDKNKILAAYGSVIGVNPKFTSLVCAKGPITLSRLQSISAGYYGWTTSRNSIAFYSGTFSNSVSTEYTLIHELGHIIDNRNAGLRATFVSMLPSGYYNCFDYPAQSRCNNSTGDIESFAEAITLYATNYKNYNLKQQHPKEHAWLKSNVFGGIEY